MSINMNGRALVSLTAIVCWLVVAVGAAQQKKTVPQKKAPAAASSPARAKAEETYRSVCQVCHGPEGNAPLKDMNLADGEWKHGATTAAIAQTISEGVKGTAMLPFKDKYSKAEILELAKLVRSFSTAKKAAPKKQ